MSLKENIRNNQIDNRLLLSQAHMEDDSFEEEHDVKMDYVITQKEIIKPSPRF